MNQYLSICVVRVYSEVWCCTMLLVQCPSCVLLSAYYMLLACFSPIRCGSGRPLFILMDFCAVVVRLLMKELFLPFPTLPSQGNPQQIQKKIE